MKDIEDLDIEEIRMEVEEAIKDIHIDIEEMQIEIADAMKNIKEIDVEEILKEVSNYKFPKNSQITTLFTPCALRSAPCANYEVLYNSITRRSPRGLPSICQKSA